MIERFDSPEFGTLRTVEEDGKVTISRTAKLTGKGQRHLLDKFLGGAA